MRKQCLSDKLHWPNERALDDQTFADVPLPSLPALNWHVFAIDHGVDLPDEALRLFPLGIAD